MKNVKNVYRKNVDHVFKNLIMYMKNVNQEFKNVKITVYIKF